MNNDLEQISEERLMKLSEYDCAGAEEVCSLARIALAAKQAKPMEVLQFIINNPEKDGYIEWADCNQDYFNSISIDHRRVLYTTPQPAHTEQNEMLNKASSLSESIGELRKQIDSSGGYDFEALRSEQVNSPETPDGWKLVPIEPTDEQLRLMLTARFPATFREHLRNPLNGPKSRVEVEKLIVEVTNQYKTALSAAPKPERE